MLVDDNEDDVDEASGETGDGVSGRISALEDAWSLAADVVVAVSPIISAVVEAETGADVASDPDALAALAAAAV